MMAEAIKPDEGQSPDISISYKPQYLEAQDKNVQAVLSKYTNVNSKRFENRIAEPLGLKNCMKTV